MRPLAVFLELEHALFLQRTLNTTFDLVNITQERRTLVNKTIFISWDSDFKITHSSWGTKSSRGSLSFLVAQLQLYCSYYKENESQRNQFSTCCRKAMSWLVPHLSGFGRLRSFRYSTSLSQSFGLYTLPVLELITIQDCWSFWRTCMGEVWALQCTTATWVERSCSKQCLNRSLN